MHCMDQRVLPAEYRYLGGDSTSRYVRNCWTGINPDRQLRRRLLLASRGAQASLPVQSGDRGINYPCCSVALAASTNIGSLDGSGIWSG